MELSLSAIIFQQSADAADAAVADAAVADAATVAYLVAMTHSGWQLAALSVSGVLENSIRQWRPTAIANDSEAFFDTGL